MTDPKMVPESDLIALKESHKTALADLGTTHTGEISKLGEEHTSTLEGLQGQVKVGTDELVRVRATIKDLEEKGSTHTATSEELKAAKDELKTSKASLKTLQETVATDMRTGLIEGYGVKEEALKDKSVAELTVIKEALSSTGGTKSKQYTSAGGGGGGGEKTSGREKVKAGLEAGDLKAT